MIGEGFAIKPSNGNFVSPVDGEVTLMAETGHAYSIKTPDGIEVLVHIGLDTVNLNTKRQPNEPMKGFSQIAKVGDKVHVGDPIVTADLKLISNEKYETITPCIVIKNDITMNKTIHHTIESGTVTKGTIVLEV
jgi:glucose-specific phosphotransferase system IIA component